MSIVVISCLEKLNSFYSYGRQITHQDTELSDAPNITLVSQLIRASGLRIRFFLLEVAAFTASLTV